MPPSAPLHPQRVGQQQAGSLVSAVPSALSTPLSLYIDVGPRRAGQGDAECPVPRPLFRSFLTSLLHHL